MANTKTAKKELRKNLRRYVLNKSQKTYVRTVCKSAELAIASASTTLDEVKGLLSKYQSVAMIAAKKNVFNRLAVSRKVSRLTLRAKARFGDQY